MTHPTAKQFLLAHCHLQSAVTDAAAVHILDALATPAASNFYADACLRNFRLAAAALGFALVPQPVPAMDAPTQEASHEVIAFPISEKKAGAASVIGAGCDEKEPA